MSKSIKKFREFKKEYEDTQYFSEDDSIVERLFRTEDKKRKQYRKEKRKEKRNIFEEE